MTLVIQNGAEKVCRTKRGEIYDGENDSMWNLAILILCQMKKS
jgi:hypothetical protein